MLVVLEKNPRSFHGSGALTPATTELSNGQLWDTGIGGSARLPLPDKFNGKMEHWEDWSWQVKAYVSLFKVEALRVLENAEVATIPSTDDALEQTELVDTELMKFSRQWHYLLTPITSESARLVVRGNTELNGFESWRLMAKRF